MQLPSVVSLKTYVKPSTPSGLHPLQRLPARPLQCQYCGARDDLTFDHLIPRSQRRPDDLGQRRRRLLALQSAQGQQDPRRNPACVRAQMPFQPTVHDLHRNGRLFPPNYLHESWLDYLYWDTELDP